MDQQNAFVFSAKIEIIGINPFVFVPQNILQSIFIQAKKEKGFIPIKGNVNGKPFQQTLVKYSGEWRLYINTIMVKNSPKRIGEIIEISISHDPDSREIKIPPEFKKALNADNAAQLIFEQLSHSRKQEIFRNLVRIKTKESFDNNITRAINFLNGKESYLGRKKP